MTLQCRFHTQQGAPRDTKQSIKHLTYRNAAASNAFLWNLVTGVREKAKQISEVVAAGQEMEADIRRKVARVQQDRRAV